MSSGIKKTLLCLSLLGLFANPLKATNETERTRAVSVIDKDGDSKSGKSEDKVSIVVELSDEKSKKEYAEDKPQRFFDGTGYILGGALLGLIGIVPLKASYHQFKEPDGSALWGGVSLIVSALMEITAAASAYTGIKAYQGKKPDTKLNYIPKSAAYVALALQD